MSDEKEQIKEREEREHLDRAWSSNDKVQFDNVISHNNVVARYAEIALGTAVKLQEQLNTEYLRSVQQEREHADAREKERLEDNRYTLDRLYSVYPEEAAGLVALLQSIIDLQKVQTEKTGK